MALSSDVRKLLSFFRDAENLDGDELIKACAENDIAVIRAPASDPFHGQTADVRREWKLFGLWLVASGHSPDWVKGHLGGVSPFRTVSAWMGEAGDRFRTTCRFKPATFSNTIKAEWASFVASRAMQTEAEMDAEFEAANDPPVKVQRRKRR